MTKKYSFDTVVRLRVCKEAHLPFDMEADGRALQNLLRGKRVKMCVAAPEKSSAFLGAVILRRVKEN